MLAFNILVRIMCYITNKHPKAILYHGSEIFPNNVIGLVNKKSF